MWLPQEDSALDLDKFVFPWSDLQSRHKISHLKAQNVYFKLSEDTKSKFERFHIENAKSLKSGKTGQFCTVHEIGLKIIVNELRKFSNFNMS